LPCRAQAKESRWGNPKCWCSRHTIDPRHCENISYSWLRDHLSSTTGGTPKVIRHG